eukprot:g4192.t1
MKISRTTLSTWLFLLTILTCSADNWVQLSGPKLQNILRPARTVFTPRWGHAVVVLTGECRSIKDPNCNGQRELVDRLFVIGGDDYDEYEGGGGFLNDAYYTYGEEFNTRVSETEANQYGGAKIRRVSRLIWKQAALALFPPPNVKYYEWIACAVMTGYPVYPCDPVQDAFWADKRFMPRRNHRAVEMTVTREVDGELEPQKLLFVIGGLARSGRDIVEGWERMHAGIEPPRGSRWREEAVLMNDIWSTPEDDPGTVWTLEQAGCTHPQSDLILGNGTRDASCRCPTEENPEYALDCKLNTKCEPCDTPGVTRGTCTCQMWSPRERHAVAVYDGKMWVMGGITYGERQTCGKFACGGGYLKVMNDVWSSTDAISWTTEVSGTRNAEWMGRAGHGLVILRNRMWVYGGRSAVEGEYGNRPYLRDVWSSANGRTWRPDYKNMNIEWEARSDFVGVAHDDKMFVMSGYSDNGYLDDVWWWGGGEGDWYQDYGLDSEAKDYITIYSKLEMMNTLTPEELQKLHTANITRIVDLALATSAQIRALQHPHVLNFPNVCEHKALAEATVEYCATKALMSDRDSLYEELGWDGVVERIGEERLKENQEKTEAEKDEEFDYCKDWDPTWEDEWVYPLVVGVQWEGSVPYTCRNRFSNRSHSAGISYQGRLYVIGGHAKGANNLTNDVWFRDEDIPTAEITQKPQSFTTDSTFKFTARKGDRNPDPSKSRECEGCIFEYEIENAATGQMVREWTQTLGDVDYFEWLEGGTYTIRVRALDRAGNVDVQYVLPFNEYTWTYEEPLPLALILGLTFLGIFILGGAYGYYRYRKKKKALERYAMKRMRRKFKRIQKDKNKKAEQERRKQAKERRKNKLSNFAKEAARREKAKGAFSKGGKGKKGKGKKKKRGKSKSKK